MEQYRNFNHSRAKAIRTQCYECCGCNSAEVRRCPAKGCALWAFRLGYEVNEDGTRRHSANSTLSPLSDTENDFFDEGEQILYPDQENGSVVVK